MRYVWALVFALLISGKAFSGGMSGGTGIGGLIDEIVAELESFVKLPIQIDPDTVRRILMRLCINGEAEVQVGDKTFKLTWKRGPHESEEPRIEVVEVSR